MYTMPQKLRQVDALSNSVHLAMAWLWALVLTTLSVPVFGCVHACAYVCRGQKLTWNVLLGNSPPCLMRQDSSLNQELTSSASPTSQLVPGVP